jgi:hypothetical protein
MNDRQRLEAIIAVIGNHLPPDGISTDEAMNEIIGLVDPLPEQEPVSTNDHLCAMLRQIHDVLACTSLPMKRKWVGLTDNEMFDAMDSYSELENGRKIEQLLKEKNT